MSTPPDDGRPPVAPASEGDLLPRPHDPMPMPSGEVPADEQPAPPEPVEEELPA